LEIISKQGNHEGTEHTLNNMAAIYQQEQALLHVLQAYKILEFAIPSELQKCCDKLEYIEGKLVSIIYQRPLKEVERSRMTSMVLHVAKSTT